jgi:hypothetical protein
MNWERVARYLERAASEKQSEANAFGADKRPGTDRQKDDGVLLLRTLAAAIRYGLQH